MAKRKVYSVEPRSSKAGWKVKQQGGKTVTKTPTKTEAVKTASKVARKDKKASVVIRKANGRIQEERTYPRGSGPRKTKG
jgi:uncharacterized protein DUF2188